MKWAVWFLSSGSGLVQRVPDQRGWTVSLFTSALYFSLTYINTKWVFLISSFSCFLKFWDKEFSLFPTWFRLLFVVYQSSKIKSFHYFKYYVIILFFEEGQWTNQYNRLNNTWKDFPEWYRQYKLKYHFKIIKIIRIRR